MGVRRKISFWAAFAALLVGGAVAHAQPTDPANFIAYELLSHEGKSGVYILDKGSDALIARGWLAENARQSIDVQYFIWSTDNIGMLALEALLRAADRGIQVRIIVDDLLIKTPDKTLLALALHPNIDIKIYNPKLSVGVPLQTKMLNVLTGLRGVNQRMHNKAMIVDRNLAIVGGRNMAAEYFDYNRDYNFRDRDVLLLGAVVSDVSASFQEYWDSPVCVSVESQYNGFGLLKKRVEVRNEEVKDIYAELHALARSRDNFPDEVRVAIADLPKIFTRIAQNMYWGDVRFISDHPGKNEGSSDFGGGGVTTRALAEMFKSAQQRVIIQSPYLVLSDKALELFRAARERGITIRISTNSLASTDNLMAFSGYRNQREILLGMGIEVFEYKPNPEIEKELVQRLVAMKEEPPVFALHAKSMVVDGKEVFIGTYNLDPRSENLNTELGVIIKSEKLAKAVEDAIEIDMLPQNSWSARVAPDDNASPAKRGKVLLLRGVPLQPLL